MFRSILTSIGSLFNDSHTRFSANVRRKYFIDEFDTWLDARDKSRLEKDLLSKSFAAAYAQFEALAGTKDAGDWPGQLIRISQVKIDGMPPQFFWDKDAAEVTQMFFDKLLTSAVLAGSFDRPPQSCPEFLQQYILKERPDKLGRCMDRLQEHMVMQHYPELWPAWQAVVAMYDGYLDRSVQIQNWVDINRAKKPPTVGAIELPQDMNLF